MEAEKGNGRTGDGEDARPQGKQGVAETREDN